MYARPETRDQDYDRLIRNSYARPVDRPRLESRLAATMTVDAGTEVIPQPGISSAPPDFTEYVVEREPTTAPTISAPPVPPAVPAPASSAPPPLAAPIAQPAPAVPPATPAPSVVPPPEASSSAPSTPVPAPPPIAPAPIALPPGAASSLTTDDLAADMQAILTGASRYNQETGAVEPAAAPAQPSVSSGMSAGPPPRPMPDAPNEQSIFDRISQSMEYSNSFDLGTVDVSRFNQFAQADAARRAPVAPPAPVAYAAPQSVPIADPVAEPMAEEDPFQGIPPEAFAGISLSGPCGATNPITDYDPEHSAPMYDTGEHVQTGGDLYPNQLRVGSGSGETFSYGQIISMGDFYASAEAMRRAAPAELTTLKGYITQNTDYYKRGKTGAGNIDDDTWNTATRGRYLTLAEENYAHFSPPSVLGMTDPITMPTNKDTWEGYHEQAIAEMQQLVIAHPNATPSPVGPLATNAFGDHFLTDAFASGHLVNKELFLAKVRRAVYAGSTNNLNAAGKTFLDTLATRAWSRAKVSSAFSPLETVDTTYFLHWRINSADRFKKLLIKIAEAEPKKVTNLVLKALHDNLNKVGVRVTNTAGDPEWTLHGDGYMDATSLAIMKRAVKQSADNILSPGILVSQSSRLPMSVSSHPNEIAKVWKHVPQPTAAGLASARGLFNTFSDPTNAVLMAAMVDVIEQKAALIAKELVARGVLRTPPP